MEPDLQATVHTGSEDRSIEGRSEAEVHKKFVVDWSQEGQLLYMPLGTIRTRDQRGSAIFHLRIASKATGPHAM